MILLKSLKYIVVIPEDYVSNDNFMYNPSMRI